MSRKLNQVLLTLLFFFCMAVIASVGLYSIILWMYVMTSLKLSLFIVCVVNGTTEY